MTHHPVVILHTDEPGSALDQARAAHPDLAFHCCDSYAALPVLMADVNPEILYSIRFAGTPGFPRDAILTWPSLRWVSVGGSGTDHLAGWDAARLTVTNAAGAGADMMAEYVLGAMLHFTLDRPGYARAQGARQWIAGKMTPLAGKRILIVGMGHTGQAIAWRCKAMGLHVTGVRARPVPMPPLDAVHGTDALPDLWPKADFVAICVPLLASTQGLVSAAAISAMKPGAVFIDVSRGGVTDQVALAAALANGHLGGAALDVFEVEPLPDTSPFWAMENVIVTPHSSSIFDGWATRSLAMFCDNLDRYLQGAPLLNVVDPTRGY